MKKTIAIAALLTAAMLTTSDAFAQCGFFGRRVCRSYESCGYGSYRSCGSDGYSSCGSCVDRGSCGGGRSCAKTNGRYCRNGTCGTSAYEETFREPTTQEVDPIERVSPCESVDENPQEKENVSPESVFVELANRYRSRRLNLSDRLKAACVLNSQYQNRYGLGHYGFHSTWELAAPGGTPEEAIQCFYNNRFNSPHWSILTSGSYSNISVGFYGGYCTVQLW